jgi:hypothetical protein
MAAANALPTSTTDAIPALRARIGSAVRNTVAVALASSATSGGVMMSLARARSAMALAWDDRTPMSGGPGRWRAGPLKDPDPMVPQAVRVLLESDAGPRPYAAPTPP